MEEEKEVEQSSEVHFGIGSPPTHSYCLPLSSPGLACLRNPSLKLCHQKMSVETDLFFLSHDNVLAYMNFVNHLTPARFFVSKFSHKKSFYKFYTGVSDRYQVSKFAENILTLQISVTMYSVSRHSSARSSMLSCSPTQLIVSPTHSLTQSNRSIMGSSFYIRQHLLDLPVHNTQPPSIGRYLALPRRLPQ